VQIVIYAGHGRRFFGDSVAPANSKAVGAVGCQRNFDKHWSARGTVAFGDHYMPGAALAAAILVSRLSFHAPRWEQQISSV